jgi:RHS repeat-associated protein
VLAPDTPAQQQDLLGSDSASRPYAVSNQSGALYVSHALPGYQPASGSASAMHMPALGLTYSSIAAERRPIFINRYELDPAANVPETVSARLKFNNGSWSSSKYYDTSPSTAKWNKGDIMQISLQADAGSLATGRYSYDFETTANYSGSSITTTYSGTVTVINEESSVFGEGWTLDILDRLHVVTGGVILNQGAGNSLWFASGGSGTYTTPAGDFSTLVDSAGTYTRTLPNGVKHNFNSSGLLTSIVDLNSNRVTFTYDGSNNLSTITDANSQVTTFSYSGSCGASNHVCSVTDPANRITTFTYNASGQLLSIKDPDNAISTFSYDSSSGRMLTSVDPMSNTTSFTYNFAGRLTTVTRPDSTTEQFNALQLQSLCDSSECTQSSPGTALLAAEAVADYTDPRSNAWDYRMDWNGFGLTTQMTDPLGQTEPAGHMSVYHRNSNGLVLQDTDRVSRNTAYEYDSKANVTKITWPDGTKQQFEYNSNSQITKKTDEQNRVTTWTYDGEGNLTQIKEADPDGGGSQTSPITTFTYTADGFVETITDARNNVTTFSYDSRDRNTQITHPGGDKVTFTYDNASNVATRKDERGNTTSFTYDAMDRLLTETDPLSNISTYQYDSGGNLTKITQPDPDGGGSLTSPILTFTYNSMNRQVTSIDPTNNTTTYGYDNSGNLASVTDALSRITTFTYDELNQRITHKTPLSNVTTTTYDGEGQVLEVKDPLSELTTFSYNNRGLMEGMTDSVGSRTTFSYDGSGNSTGSQQSGGGSTATTYDSLNRPVDFTDQVGNTTSTTYDAVSNRTSVKDALGHTLTLTYDARDRLATVKDATNNTTTLTYDAAGNVTVVIDGLSRLTTFSYDSANRLTSITQPDPDGGGSLTSPITTFTYDNLGRLISIRDPVNNLTTWTYDSAGRVLTELDPNNRTLTYTYNAAGELTTIVDRRNQRREFVYDNDGRMTQEKWCTTATGSCTASHIFTYTYNGRNELTEVNEPDSRYTFTYDDMGRMTAMSVLGSNMPLVRLTNTYDGLGRRTNLSDNLSSAGSTTFTYDSAHRVTNIKFAVGGTIGPNVTFTYDAADRLTAISRRIGTSPSPPPNRVLTTFTYDNADRMTAITHTYSPGMGSPSTLATFTYSYNAASELTNQTNQDGTLTYSYDNTGQLTGVDGSGGTCGATGCDESFSYDVNGNRTMTGYTTGAGNRLTSDGTWNYTFDDNGNTLTKTRISDGQKYEFTWDYRNRLTQVVLKNSGGTILQQSDYTYDAFDRRIIKSFDDDGPGPHSATVTKTIYDGPDFAANPYVDFDGSNNVSMRYLYGPAVDMVLARRDSSGNVAWYLADHLGTVRDIANTSGSVLDHVSYSAYGKVTAETNPSNGDRFKFTAYQHDSETGVYHSRARSYDPVTGRFISADPMGLAAGDANLYRYVSNRPITLVDPTGLQSQPARPGSLPFQPGQIPGDPTKPKRVPIEPHSKKPPLPFMPGEVPESGSLVPPNFEFWDDESLPPGSMIWPSSALLSDGLVRNWYSTEALKLRDMGLNQAAGDAARTRLQIRSRNMSSAPGGYWSQYWGGAAGSKAGGRYWHTNPGYNQAGRLMTGMGTAGLILSGMQSADRIRSAPPGEQPRTIASELGGWVGALAVGKAGAHAGAYFGFVIGGPLGGAAGGVVGGLLGGALGYLYGTQMGRDIYDQIMHNNQSIEAEYERRRNGTEGYEQF